MFHYFFFLTVTTALIESSQPAKFCQDNYPIVIIGSGLAGHSTAAELISQQKKFGSNINSKLKIPIIIFEKEKNYGGNSMKATSGINGVNTEFQKKLNIEDNIKDYEKDVIYSYSGNKNDEITPLIQILSNESGSSVNWLKNEFDLDLSLISQLGGHSHPRTHRPSKGPTGATIVKNVHDKIESLIQFNYNCEVNEIIMDEETKSVIGIKYFDKNDNKIKEMYTSSIILASGGYANDHHNQNSLLNQYSTNNEYLLPTTNGDFATGDGIKMGQHIGAKLIDMNYIQIHPTGFVDPVDPNAKTKFLAPEALRGVGGIMINSNGKRFTNELDLRSNVVFAMNKQISHNNSVIFRLLLNENAAKEFGPNFYFYEKIKTLIKKYNNLHEFCQDTKINEDNLKETFEKYQESAKNGKDEFNKTIFPTVFNINEPIYSAIITPVIHYTMGGLAINTKAQILDINGDVINGLYGAGEVTGGVHGKNRLAGNSLLECVVFGRIAAKNALQYCQQFENNNNNNNNNKNEL